MITVQEIEAAILSLSPSEFQEFRRWFEDYLESQLELADAVKARLEESRREISVGRYTVRRGK